MEASSALPSVKLVDLKQPKLFRPLVVSHSLVPVACSELLHTPLQASCCPYPTVY